MDRMSLANFGLSAIHINRLYHALFVYSVGFHEMLGSVLDSAANKYAALTSIWKTYSILLEYAWKSDYRLVISEISDKYK